MLELIPFEKVGTFLTARLHSQENSFQLDFNWDDHFPPFIKKQGKAIREDELWKSTCFEIFLGRSDGSYLEGNFAPNGSWNIYEFDSLRQGMRPFEISETPQVTMQPLHCQISVPLSLEGFITLNITAVIEESNGKHFYYALKHSQERPDFHHPDGWISLDLINS